MRISVFCKDADATVAMCAQAHRLGFILAEKEIKIFIDNDGDKIGQAIISGAQSAVKQNSLDSIENPLIECVSDRRMRLGMRMRDKPDAYIVMLNNDDLEQRRLFETLLQIIIVNREKKLVALCEEGGLQAIALLPLVAQSILVYGVQHNVTITFTAEEAVNFITHTV